MIKFSHAIVALPFSLASLVPAHQVVTLNGKSISWIVFTMVGTRSAAMRLDRLPHISIDEKNHRTVLEERD
jgi:4-hydroxybenzoate polyprenyltransferase